VNEKDQHGMPAVDPGAPTVTIGPTDDVGAVRALGVASGLDESERDETGLQDAWLRAPPTGSWSAIVLERSGGLDVVNWMAVDAAFRGHGIASRLLAELERRRAPGACGVLRHARARGSSSPTGSSRCTRT
jgi:GNAT superfamily N-acetyltransferase